MLPNENSFSALEFLFFVGPESKRGGFFQPSHKSPFQWVLPRPILKGFMLRHITTFVTSWYLQRVKPFLISPPSPFPQELGGAGEQLIGKSTCKLYCKPLSSVRDQVVNVGSGGQGRCLLTHKTHRSCCGNLSK